MDAGVRIRETGPRFQLSKDVPVKNVSKKAVEVQ